MSVWTVLLPAAGVLILAVVIWDVFVTVLQHWEGGGPLGERVVHGTWRVAVRFLSRVPGPRRRRLLGYLGPVLIPLLIALWAVLTILGFALVYTPFFPQSFSADYGVPPPGGFADALYFSGVSFFTIGYGDIVPTAWGVRALGVIEGGAGFALVTLAVSYFLSVSAGYTGQRSLAESLHAQAGESADAARVIAGYLPGGGDPTLLAAELGRIRDGLAALGSQYAHYPILHYFIARTPRQSLLRLLFVAHDLSTLLDCTVDGERLPAAAGLGRRSGVYATATDMRSSLARTLLGGEEAAERAAREERERADEGRWDERFVRARETLRAAGVPVREDPQALAEYRRARREWEPELRASAAALGEDWQGVRGGN